MKMLSEDLTQRIIGAAIAVHRQLGPGLLESVYEECLAYELTTQLIPYERQKAIPVTYGDVLVECGFRADLLVDRLVLLELKAVESIAPIHKAQVLTYMKLAGCKIGLLINFNVVLLKDGIKRFVL
jgi:GxxExxY protein